MKERAVAPSHALLSIIYYVRQKLYHCLGCLAVLSRRDDEIQLYTTAFSSAWIPKEEEGVTLRKKMHPQPQTTERHWNREVLWEIRKRGKQACGMGVEFVPQRQSPHGMLFLTISEEIGSSSKTPPTELNQLPANTEYMYGTLRERKSRLSVKSQKPESHYSRPSQWL